MSVASYPDLTAAEPLRGRAVVPFVAGAARGTFAWSSLRIGLVAGAIGVMLAAGGGAAYALRHHLPGSAPVQPDPSLVMIHRLQDQVSKLQQSLDAMRAVADSTRADDQLRGLKRSVEAMKQDVEQVRSASVSTAAQIAAKIDKVDHDPTPKLAEIATRLDRIEKQAATVAPPPAAVRPATPAVPASASPAKPAAAQAAPGPAPKPVAVQAVPSPAPRSEITQVPATVAGRPPAQPALVADWVLRDVYDGMALVERRGGGLREVTPGEYLPGAGQVRSIQRRGRAWVVLTSRGVIGDTAF